MAEIAFVLPILPGQEQADLDTFRAMESSRRDEYEQALRSAGIRRHTAWHQRTPDGTIAIVVMDVDDPAAIGSFTTSDAPFNQWFRDQMKQVHGVDISQSAPDVQQVHEIRL